MPTKDGQELKNGQSKAGKSVTWQNMQLSRILKGTAQCLLTSKLHQHMKKTCRQFSKNFNKKKEPSKKSNKCYRGIKWKIVCTIVYKSVIAASLAGGVY